MFLPLLFSTTVFAAEGMWLPGQLRAEQLEALGFALQTGEISREDGPVLGPVVSMGHCTASFVSETGLLITNGHCIRSYLHYASQGGENLIKDGFIADNLGAEKSAGPAARIFIPMDRKDVTAQVQDNLKGVKTDAKRHVELQRIRTYIASTCEADGNTRCEVVEQYGGMRWELVRYREIQDLRLVYAPPDSVVFFGGETDNWMWPRHAGDMALFRAYVAPDGSTASYDEANVAYTPSQWYQVGIDDLDPGDPVLIAGFPASTSRYRTAAEMKHAALIRYPDGVDLFTELIRSLREHAIESDEAAAQLGPLIFSLSNQRKNYQGMLENMTRDDLVDAKVQAEAKLDEWIAADRKRQRKYAKEIDELREVVAHQQSSQPRDRLIQLMARYPSALYASRTAYRLSLERQKDGLDRRSGFQARDEQRIEDRFNQLERSLHIDAERDILSITFKHYVALDPDQRINSIDQWLSQHGGPEKSIEYLFSDNRIQDPAHRNWLLTATQAELQAASSDQPWLELAILIEEWANQEQVTRNQMAGATERLRPVYMKAWKEMNDGPTYPDANGTLRISIGQISGYSPKEAVLYSPQTTVRGMVEKAGSDPFSLPASIQSSARTADQSRWADPELDHVPLNFISSLDNTGGNSGSPTLNGKGELVGLAFDRNYEGMAADWAFDHQVTRSIHVDLRFCWWLMSEVQSADHILQELGIESQKTD